MPAMPPPLSPPPEVPLWPSELVGWGAPVLEVASLLPWNVTGGAVPVGPEVAVDPRVLEELEELRPPPSESESESESASESESLSPC